MKKARIETALPLVVVALISAACGGALPSAPEPVSEVVCAVQSLSCFHYRGMLVAAGQTVEVEGWSQDLPTPGFENRWRYLVSAPAGARLAGFQTLTKSWLGGAAVVWPSGRGGMFNEALTAPGGAIYWRLEMLPTDDAVAAQFAALAGAQEYRAQRFQAVSTDGGGAEILITEPE